MEAEPPPPNPPLLEAKLSQEHSEASTGKVSTKTFHHRDTRLASSAPTLFTDTRLEKSK